MGHRQRNQRRDIPDISVLLDGAWSALDRARLLQQSIDSSRMELIDVARIDVAMLDVAMLDVASPAGRSTQLNAAVERAQAKLILILGAGETPHRDLLQTHVNAHAAHPAATAIQGMSSIIARERQLPVVPHLSLLRLLGAPRLPVDLRSLIDRRGYDWRAVCATQTSLPRSAILDAGGFATDRFGDGIGAVSDLVYRARLPVVFRADAMSNRGDIFDVQRWLDDRFRQGVTLARMATVHDDPNIIWWSIGGGQSHLDELERQLLVRTELALPVLARVADAVARHGLDSIRGDERLSEHLDTLGLLALFRGVLADRTGSDPLGVVTSGPTPGRLTSCIMLSHNAVDMTRLSLARLRRFSDPAHPIELIVVDNGSEDGSVEFLRNQPDVTLIANQTNVGAPCARNQALQRVRGEFVVFMDNDAMVTAGWLSRLLYHAEVDGSSGFVGPVTDRASHGQAVVAPTAVGDIDGFARQRATSQHRRSRPATLLSSFCILARREVVAALGGFDPRFSPWGFEDDDISLRAHLLGYRNRVALDVFVRHLPYTGPKLARHGDLLTRNWRRFAHKWGMPDDTAYGQGLDHLTALTNRRVTTDGLFIAPDTPEPVDDTLLNQVAQPQDDRPTPRDRQSCIADALVATVAPDQHLLLSVIVPTYKRPDLITNLLSYLDAQSLPPDRFEVIIVDDGSPEPLVVDCGAHAYHIELLRQPNAGPGAARNLALTRCRARLTLIFNDDAVPADDNLEQHVRAHRARPGQLAVLGTFDFVARARQEAFTQIIENTSLLFNYVAMRDGESYGWWYFWTCNLSIETDALRQIGGFDSERFREAIVEDVEVGYRLATTGYRVLFWAAARCGHDHILTAQGYYRRMVRLGVNLTRMYRKHNDPQILWRRDTFELNPELLFGMQLRTEVEMQPLSAELEALSKLADERRGTTLTASELTPLRQRLRQLGQACTQAGILLEECGSDLWTPIVNHGPKPITSIVLLDATAGDERACRAAIWQHAERAEPFELILIVDQHVTDGLRQHEPGAKWVECAPDTPIAQRRQAGLAAATGDLVVFLESWMRVSTGWLGRLRHHAEVDAHVAAVLAVGDDPSDAMAADSHRCQYARMLRPGLLLVRREHVALLGGFDSVMAAHGLEVEDLTLRAHLAGFRNRMAIDVSSPVRAPAATLGIAKPGATDVAAWNTLTARWRLQGIVPGDWRSVIAHLEALALPLDALQPEDISRDNSQPDRRPRLSVCLIVRDEEANIGRAIASVAAVAHEIVVVDTGSVDATIARANAAGARVVEHPWHDDFAEVRNVALDHAIGDWVLTLDADEQLLDPQALSQKIAQRPEPAVAYLIPIRNLQDREGIDEVFISYAPRLYARDPTVRWRGIIHEQLVRTHGELQFVQLTAPTLLHHGYLSHVRSAREKESRNLALLERSVACDPDNARLHFAIGQTHYGVLRYEQALVALEHALTLCRNDHEANIRSLAVALAVGACFSLGRYERGMTLADKHPDLRNADLEVNAGGCCLALARLDDARQHYARARALDGEVNDGGDTASSTWRALQGLGHVSMLAGDAKAALEYYEQALGFNARHPALLLRAGEAALQLSQAESASGHFQQLLQVAPDSEEAQVGAAVSRALLGDVDGAVAALERCVEQRPNSVMSRAALSDLLVAAGALPTALEVLAPALQMQPPSDELYVRLGQVLESLGRTEESRNAYAIAVAANPSNPRARNGLKSALTVV